MPKRSRTPPKDENQAARRVVDRLIERTDDDRPGPKKRKNPAAVALGRKGGRKGGPARAAKLTPEERSRSASRAAVARWGGDRKGAVDDLP
jgi:hypothetical protein